MAFVTAGRAGAPKMTPASTALLTAHGSDDPDVGALEGVTILLVEDDRVSREALDFILTHYGACVTSTDSVNEALESFDRNPPSILVSDIGLPASDGYSLLRAIRTRESPLAARTPAIAVSGYPSGETNQRARQAGFDAFLRKPIEIRRLLKLVADLVGPSAS